MEKFSKMLHKVVQFQPIQGDTVGNCRICGEHTEHGNPVKFNTNFTVADYVSSGDCICEYCQYLVENSNTYRRTMYLLTEDEFKSFKKKDIPEIIFNLPSKPFYLYLTETYQKVGWVRMNQVPNTGDSETIKTLIDYDIVEFTVEDLQEKYDIVNKLRALKITKDAINSGDFEMYQYQRIIEEYGIDEARRLHEYCRENNGNPVWDLACYIGR
ncbi:MAG: hypothetical protein BZ138_05850 [Methanosphaera sp. rholeuAM270]|nr:MAG: hypothetical protein BZ138_05850 [Methanosphaera sp. rholeuAM270]